MILVGDEAFQSLQHPLVMTVHRSRCNSQHNRSHQSLLMNSGELSGGDQRQLDVRREPSRGLDPRVAQHSLGDCLTGVT